ncbi:MAG: class A beta-lactamase-related serine hydrolase [Candidatus Omnitrophica bacterium]|nr:class A beta-lactamase-related serine hydrolase [Candidatus Omnitrophota bacterium]
MKTKTTFLLIFIIIFGIVVFFSYKAYKIYEENLSFNREQCILNKKKEGWLRLKKSLENKIGNFKGEVGLVVEDLNTGWVISFNEDTLIPSASLVKVPIMLSYFYAAQEDKVNLKDNIKLKSFEMVSGSKVLGKFPVGSQFMVEELFDPMITVSDNAAANALIDLLGFDTLNAYFKKMGLKNTNIARNMLDFRGRREGQENYTTAADMAYILEKLYRRQFLNQEISEKCLLLLNQQKINDRIPRDLPKDEVSVAHKTGLERHICHDAGIVYTQKGNFLICVLVKHGNRYALPAKKLISDIALSTYNYYKNFN